MTRPQARQLAQRRLNRDDETFTLEPAVKGMQVPAPVPDLTSRYEPRTPEEGSVVEDLETVARSIAEHLAQAPEMLQRTLVEGQAITGLDVARLGCTRNLQFIHVPNTNTLRIDLNSSVGPIAKFHAVVYLDEVHPE
jgi:hypothetical protein